MNLKKIKIVIISVIVALFIFGGYMIYNGINNPLDISNQVEIEVKSGDSFYSVLDKLNNDDILKSKSIIKMYTKLTKAEINMKEGTYILKPDMDIKDIIEVLNSNPAYSTIIVTIPEGYTIEKIAKTLEKSNVCSYDEFITAVENYQLPEYVKKDSNKRYSLEGFLFPDTYHFNEHTTANDVIKTMLTNFENVILKIEKDKNISIKKEDYEKIVNIASLVQNESRLQSEAPVIASVIFNRINKDMKLQIDATVIYALGYHVDFVLNSHLAIDSKYNTYMYSGLPVGAISNPGKIAIEAVISPANTDYLYYLLKDVTGVNPEHYFTNSDIDFMNKRQEFGYNDI